MIEENISRALQSSAIGFIQAASIPDMGIKALGRIQKPPNDQRYIEFLQIRNNRLNSYWRGKRIYQGIFRLLFHWPVDDTGDYPVTEYIDEIALNYADRPIFHDGNAAVKIYQEPNLGDAVDNGQNRTFPLSLSYRCFA